MKLKKINDVSHGWLAVPSHLILKCGIEKEISPFSYMNPMGTIVYLEEDCDMGLFLDKCEKLNLKINIYNFYSKKNSKIRSMQPYRYN